MIYTALILSSVLLLLRGSQVDVWICLGAFGCVLCLHILRRRHLITSLFAILVILAAAIAPTTLILFGFVYLAFKAPADSLSERAWYLPWLSITVLSLCSVTLFTFDYFGYAELINAYAPKYGNAWEHIRQLCRVSPPASLSALEATLRIGLCGALISYWSSDASERQSFLRAACAASILIPLFTALQLWLDIPVFNEVNDSFWRALNRFAATFTDPNAYGIVAAVLLPLLLIARATIQSARTKHALVCWIPLWVVAALYSGSRSFLLFLAIFAALTLWSYSRRVFVVTTLVVLAGLMFLCLSSIADNTLGSSEFLPAAITRVTQGVFRTATENEGISSRTLFFKVAFSMWLDYPIFGIGLEAFRALLPHYAERLSLPLGMWSDNPNNFYLGILVEFGLIGLAAFLLSIRQLNFAPNSSEQTTRYARSGLIAAAIILILGPHLDFTEVAILVALLISFCKIAPRTFELSPLSMTLAFTFAIGIFFTRYQSSNGWYAWEGTPERRVRWSSPRADLRTSCLELRERSLHVRLLHTDLQKRPVKLSLSTPFKQIDLNVRDSSAIALEQLCTTNTDVILSAPFKLVLNVERAFIPALHGMPRDPRILGVQLIEKPAVRQP